MADLQQQHDDLPDDERSAGEMPVEVSGTEAAGNEVQHQTADSQHTEPPPSPILAKVALVLPVVAGVLEVFLPDSIGLALVIGTVLLTAVLLAIDIGSVMRWNPYCESSVSPGHTLFGVMLLWIVFFPLTYFRRIAICGPDMRGPALSATAAFLFLPWLISIWIKPAQLPACDAQEVTGIIQQLAESEFPGRKVKGVLAPREIRSDPRLQERRGSCVVLVDDERISVPYLIEWSDQKRGIFSVALMLLPQANAPSVIELIEPQLRTQLQEFRITGIDDFREVEFDRQNQERRCTCVVHTESTDITVPYVVRWHRREQIEYQVRAFVLPGPTSEDIREGLHDFLEQAFAEHEITAIDNYREIRANWEAGERIGACTVHLEQENVDVRFRIQWKDQYLGMYSLELIQEDAI